MAADSGVDRTAGRGTPVRALTGQSCADVTDAGAVALAMAIRAKTEEEHSPEPAAPPEKKTAPRPQPPVQRASHGASDSATPPTETSDPLAVFASAGAVVDFGALPDPVLGIEVDAGVAWRTLRLMAYGSVFAPSEVHGSERPGRRVSALGSRRARLLGTPRGRASALACAGYEIGTLSAEGRV